MSKHDDDKLEQKSPAKSEVGALDDTDLEKVTGGDSACGTGQHFKTVGLGMRKSAGGDASGVM
jgi:hypothetical protein